MSALDRFWNGRAGGVTGAGWEIVGAGWAALRDRVSTVLRRRNLGRAGRGLFIQAGSVIRYPERVEVGDWVRIGRDVSFTTERSSGTLRIGDSTWIDRGCHVDFTGELEIGSRCTISANVCIYSHDHGRDPRSNPNARKLVIRDHVWIGTGASILQNASEIGEGSIIAAGAVVTKPVPPGSLVGGNPARVIGSAKPGDGAGEG